MQRHDFMAIVVALVASSRPRAGAAQKSPRDAVLERPIAGIPDNGKVLPAVQAHSDRVAQPRFLA